MEPQDLDVTASPDIPRDVVAGVARILHDKQLPAVLATLGGNTARACWSPGWQRSVARVCPRQLERESHGRSQRSGIIRPAGIRSNHTQHAGPSCLRVRPRTVRRNVEQIEGPRRW